MAFARRPVTRDPQLAQARSTLDYLRTTQRRIERTTSLATGVSILLILLTSLGIIEAVFNLPRGARLWVIAIAVCVISVVAVRLWLKLREDPRLNDGWVADRFWALKLGELADTRTRDRLLNAIQIAETPSQFGEVVSDDLARDALYRAVAQVSGLNPADALDPQPQRRSLRDLSIVGTTFLLSFIIGYSTLLPAYTRLAGSFSDKQPPPDFTLSVTPSGGWCYRSEPIKFTIRAAGNFPKTASFDYSNQGGSVTSLDVRLGSGSAEIGFDGFDSPISYSVRSGSVKAGPFELNVIARPQIADIQYRLDPPAYTHTPPEQGRDNVGDIEGLPGTSVDLSIRATKALSAASFHLMRGDTLLRDSLPLDISGSAGRIRFLLREEGKYCIRLTDKDGHPDRDPVHYRIHLTRDESPAVRIVQPDGDVVLGDDMVVPLRIECEDDYGLNRLVLEYRKMEGDTSVRQHPLRSLRDAKSAQVDTLWSLGELSLTPGDVIEYWAVVYDNDNINGPKRGESEHRIVRLPTFEEIASGVEKAESKTTEDAQKTLEAAKDLQKQVSKLVEDMKRDPKVDWEKKQQLQNALDQQQKLTEKAQQLAKTLDDLVDKLDKHNLLTPETMEKYQELQKLMQEVATPEMRDAMEKLKKAMESQDPEKIRQALDQFDMNRDEFQKNIERNLAILQQLKLERQLDELARRAEELLHNQELAIDQMKRGETDVAANKLETQAKSTESLQKEIAAASKTAAENQEVETTGTLDSLGQEISRKGIPSDMRQSSGQLMQGDQQSAEQGSEETARDLASLSSGLKEAANQLKQKRIDDISGKLRRLVEEMLFIAQGQEEVMRTGGVTGTQSPRYRELAGGQQDVREGLVGVTNRLMDVAQQTFFLTPELGAKLGKALKEMDDALQDYSDRYPRNATSSQKQALGDVNRCTLELLNVMAQMKGSSSSTGYEEMMKKLSEMASQQEGLNQQSMPMPMPGQNGQSGQMPDGSTMAQLAAQQRALQAQMQQASEDAQQIQQMLGNLQEIANQMGEVGDDLEAKQINERTRNLQRQIVNRLLDATRSAHEEEYSKNRESRTGIDLSRKSPPELQLEAEQDKLRRDLLRALQEGYTPDYRKLIREYYESLGKSAAKPNP